MKHIMYGRLGTEVEFREMKNGEGEYATLGIYTPVSKYKENEPKKNEDVYYNLICVNEKEISKIKQMDLKKGDTINFIGSLSSDSYENKDGKKIVRPKYLIEYIDPEKGKGASLYKFVDDAITRAIDNFDFALEEEKKMKKEKMQPKSDKKDELSNLKDKSIEDIGEIKPF